MVRLVLSATALLACTVLPVPAQAPDAHFVRGSGALSCPDALRVVGAGGDGLVALVAWADGALSTVNRLRGDTFDLLPFVDPPGLIAQLAVNACAQRPEMTFGMALVQVFDALEPIRLATPSEPVTMSTPGAELRLRPETLRRVQERLIALGHLRGTADGVYGPATRAALVRFQAAAGLPQSGLPEVETVLRLLLGT
jgi:hypothetical protein